MMSKRVVGKGIMDQELLNFILEEMEHALKNIREAKCSIERVFYILNTENATKQ